MSHHSDEQAILSVTSDSFWEPGNYKRTTKRIDDGNRLCTELQALIQERADIEKTYAKSLRGWSKKWNDLIEKGPEYGTMEAAWKGSLVEADRLCELHLRVRDNLVNDTITQIKNWQKDTYHKSMINQLKERKEMDEAFKKAQKPWAKFLQKVERTRQDYHMACKQERTAQNQERNASGDSSLSPDQVKKMADRVSKCREEVVKNKEKYQAALAEITAYNPRYIQDMTAVFERCQQMEAQRLTFFKDVLFNFHKCLNISQDPTLPQIYEEFHHTVQNADHQKDLKWWANNHGVNMNMGWPQFEREPSSYKEKASITGAFRAGALMSASVLRRVVDWLRPKSGVSARIAPSPATSIQQTPLEYTEEFRDIAKGKSKEGLPTAPITLLHQRTVVDELPPITANNKSMKISNHSSESNTTTTGNGSTGGATIDKKNISAPIAVTIERLEIFTNVQPPSGKWKEVAGSPWQMSEASSAGRVLRLALKPPQRDHFTITEMSDQILPLDGVHNGVSPSSKTSPSKESSGGENPFEEEEWEEEEGLADGGEPGVPVRALYDYTGAESDELTFRQGDLFEKLEDEDEQGWCKGRKDGRVGLYPANYVEPVGH